GCYHFRKEPDSAFAVSNMDLHTPLTAAMEFAWTGATIGGEMSGEWKSESRSTHICDYVSQAQQLPYYRHFLQHCLFWVSLGVTFRPLFEPNAVSNKNRPAATTPAQSFSSVRRRRCLIVYQPIFFICSGV